MQACQGPTVACFVSIPFLVKKLLHAGMPSGLAPVVTGDGVKHCYRAVLLQWPAAEALVSDAVRAYLTETDL